MVPSAGAQGVNKTVTVPAEVQWTDTGIDLLPGDAFSVRAAGAWSSSPNLPMCNRDGYPDSATPGLSLQGARRGALIVRIGASVALASPFTAPSPARGRLHLGMNDDPGRFGDNIGELRATIICAFTAPAMRDFTNATLGEATKWLGELGFAPVVREGASDVPAGRIFGQDPEPGTDLHGVPQVGLRVSLGPEAPPSLINVPDVVGQPEDRAVRALVARRFQPRNRGTEPSALRPGVVARTEPPAGTPVEPGAIVEYWLARRAVPPPDDPTPPDEGPSPEPLLRVPDVRGRSVSEARAILGEAGFRAIKTAQRRTSGRSGRVVEQEPEPGARVPQRTSIRLVESEAAIGWPAVLAVALIVLVGGSTVVARVARKRTWAKTRARVAIDATLDPKDGTAAFEGPLPRGPVVRVQAGLEAGETRLDGPVPVQETEERDE
jgi:beta-lactam-binding protein with PASTA domain